MSTAQKTHTRHASVPAASRSKLLPIVLIAGVVLALIVFTAIILSASSRSQYVPQVTGSARAEVSRTLIDHGDVRMEETVQSVFRIRNIGDRPLRILDEPRVELIEGCCPPRALVSHYTIQPGEESVITLTFTMFDMMGGPHEFRVHVFTNDPTQPEIPLTILSNWIE